MISLIYIVVIFLWIVYSYLEGQREAIYYDMASKMVVIPELHPLYVAQRGSVFIIISLLCAVNTGLISLFLMGFMILSFSPIHDSAYYITRNSLNRSVYPNTWKDDSTTSTAVFEIDFLGRKILAVLSILALIGFFINI